MRSWTDVFLRSMYDNNIPVVIFSASGVGVDSIGLLLKHRWIDFPNISIVSNKLYRSKDGEMIWYSKPIIHSLNKKESVIWNNPEYKTLQHILSDKPHAIVIGDSLHDADMVDCRDDRTIVSIGPVSYTHLDVYKRQLWLVLILFSYFLFLGWIYLY